MQDRMPKRRPERMPEIISDRMPDRMPEHMPERMSDSMSERMPETMPESMPNTMPERLPDRMSGTLSEYICQTCFQMIYRKLCQNNLSWWGSPEADGKINYGDLAMNNSHLSLFFPSRHVGKPCLTGVFFSKQAPLVPSCDLHVIWLLLAGQQGTDSGAAVVDLPGHARLADSRGDHIEAGWNLEVHYCSRNFQGLKASP